MTHIGKIRVCHLVSDDGWGGAESVVAALLRAQATSDDIDVRLLALNEGQLVGIARQCGIPVEVASEGGRGFLALLREVNAYVIRTRPVIVHSHRYKENLLSYLTAWRCGARSVVTLHGSEPLRQPLLRLRARFRQLAMHRLARWVDARFVAVSEDLRVLLGLPTSRCVVIPNGVPFPPTALEFHRDASGSHPPTIGWVGRMVPIKGLPLLVEALRLLPPSLASVKLLLVGDGPEREPLEAFVRELGLGDRVEFSGFVADPVPLRARMSLFALPSEHEGIPVALLEAMADAIPCIASAVGGILEVDGGTGAVRLVSSRAPRDWARELSRLLADPSASACVGARGRARVAQSFSLDATVDAYRSLYRAVLHERSLNRCETFGAA